MNYNHDKYLQNTYIGVDVNTYDNKLADYLFQRFLTQYYQKDASFLDVGCGRGYQLLTFSKWFKVFGIDQSSISLELFEKQGIEYELKTCNLEKENIPFPNDFFDVVFTKSVIEHIGDSSHFITELKRILKPGGTMIILTPAWETQYINFYDDFTHIKPFTYHGLKSALLNAELKSVEVQEFYQLPFLWTKTWLKFIPKLIALLPNAMKWKNNNRQTPNKLIRFSKETMLLAKAVK